MWAREQSVHYLKQYIVAQKTSPWIAKMNHVEDRARCALQYLGGMAGDWYGNQSACTYYHPQKAKE